jgi:hypothetical protein
VAVSSAWRGVSRLEAEAHPGFGKQVPRPGRIVLELAAQMLERPTRSLHHEPRPRHLAAWDAHVGNSPATVAASHRDDELDRLRRDLTAIRARSRDLQDHLDAAATVIAALAENTALRSQAVNSATGDSCRPAHIRKD